MVVTAAVCTPVPALGSPLASSGGHACAHAPLQALVVPWSALNRYSVRPWAFTRTGPSPVLASASVAAWPPAVRAGRSAVAAFVSPPPPQPATAAAAIAAAAAAVSVLVSVPFRVMLVLLRSGVGSNGSSHVLRTRAFRSRAPPSRRRARA